MLNSKLYKNRLSHIYAVNKKQYEDTKDNKYLINMHRLIKIYMKNNNIANYETAKNILDSLI